MLSRNTSSATLSIVSAVAAVAVLVLSFAATPASAESKVDRGQYLVAGIGGCGNCHTARGGPMKGIELAGGNRFGDPKGPFVSYAPNITPDRETGIGSWTDAQIAAAIREGKRPDGSVIGPPMAIEFFKHISDADVEAMVAYLRTVKPVRHKVKKSKYKIPLHANAPVMNVVAPPRSNTVAYGKYLVQFGHCMECHSPMVKGKIQHETMQGAGGRTFEGPWGETTSANITPDRETGIGMWTDAQIKRAITRGVRHDGTKLRPPMCFRCYAKMTTADVDAIVAYLRSIEPRKHDVR